MNSNTKDLSPIVEISTATLKYVIEVLEDYRNMTEHYRQEGEEYTAIDECIDELTYAACVQLCDSEPEERTTVLEEA